MAIPPVRMAMPGVDECPDRYRVRRMMLES